MKQRWLLFSLLISLMLPLSLLGLISSETGSRWLLQSIFAILPTLSVQQIDGRLLDRMTLTDLHYQSDSETVTAKQLIFVWQPSKLFSGTLKIVDLALDQLSVIVADSAPSEAPGGFDFNAEFGLPLQVAIENLLLTNASFQQGEQRQQLDKLQLSAFTEQGLLHIVSLSVNAKPLTALFTGRVGLGRGFPLTLSGEWQQLHWPLDGLKPQLSSEQGSLALTGSLNAYQLTLNADLNQATLPRAQLSFIGKGSLEALAIEKLELTSTAGVFQLGGDVSWQDAVLFDLHANGQQFNPGILLPDLPGSLTFNIHAKGQFADATLQLDAEIDRLSGRLRGYPVSANGKLQLADEQLTVDALKIISGANKIAVDGTLGQEQAALALAVDAPELAALWPGLSGSLTGKGRLQGAWNNPTVQFQADGKRLRFIQDNTEHSAEQFALNIDYQADAKKTSNLQLSANAVKTGNTVIEKVLLDGSGTLSQHRVNTDITSSSYGAMVGALGGSFKDALWQGGFSKLDISTPDFGRWQLDAASWERRPRRDMSVAPIRIAFTEAGIDMTLADTCLRQQAAALCVQGRYPTNGDFQFKLKATELPTGLLQAYLPEKMTLSGLLNADAELQQQKGLLTGTYRLTMPAHAKLLLQTQQDKTELTLGALTLVGKLKDSLVSADVDLALTGQDYLRAQLQLDTGKAQTVTGHISAVMANLSPVRAFVPQLSTISGQLSADLAVQGRLDQPIINGTAALKQGRVESAEAGFGLQDINLQLLASGGRNNRFQVQGEAVPVLLSKEDAPQPFQLKDMMLKLDADLQQQDGISGQYRLELPANSQLIFKTHEIDTKIALGASSVSGRIDGTRLSADINLALAAQDYVRAQLQLDSGEAQTLSGQISASMAEFALLNPFAPQLSNIKGHLKADLALTGRIDEPLLNGALNFTGGSVDIDQLGLEFRAIKLQALAFAEPNRPIVLTGSAQSGQGAVKLEGFANLRGSAELILNGSDFEVAKLPEAQIAVSPALKLTFAENQGKVTGLLKIPKAVLTLQEFPENAVQVSADEIILGEEKTEEKTSATAVNIDAAIDIELGKQVSFSGKGLETQLSGKLQINKTGEKIAMYGHVDMDKARYKSYGQDLTVRKGRFLFNGPIDKPWLDVEAIRLSKGKDVTAILSLTGPLAAPKTQLSSQPALPEAEVLAYLVTGGPLNQVSKAEGNRLASAALSYGAGQASWIADKLGLDDFEVEEGQSLQDTLATVGQYLTPDFYVGAKVGLFNRQAVLVLKHKLTDTLNVETQAGTSQRIKLNYEIDRD